MNKKVLFGIVGVVVVVAIAGAVTLAYLFVFNSDPAYLGKWKGEEEGQTINVEITEDQITYGGDFPGVAEDSEASLEIIYKYEDIESEDDVYTFTGVTVDDIKLEGDFGFGEEQNEEFIEEMKQSFEEEEDDKLYIKVENDDELFLYGDENQDEGTTVTRVEE